MSYNIRKRLYIHTCHTYFNKIEITEFISSELF